MADFDKIVVCRKCLHPIERKLLLCPRCHEKLWLDFPVLLLASVRTLAAKGWTVTGWEHKEDGPGGWRGFVRLDFAWMAPPIPTKYRHSEPFIAAELSKYDNPSVMMICKIRDELGLMRITDEWANGVPELAVPFSQDFCDKCRPQGGDWFFGVVTRCPVAGADVRFVDGLPDRCAYAAEQVMMAGMRVARLEKLEGWSKVARRILARERAKS